MLEKIKIALRISHDQLDSVINDAISEARAELIRSGVSEEMANSSDPLVSAAIRTYCLWQFTEDSGKYEQYHNAFLMQQDSLRRSNEYNGKGE